MPPLTPAEPFTAADLPRINESLELARVAVTQAKNALRAQIPGAQDLLDRAQEQEAAVKRIKQVYFPNQ